MHVHKFLKPVCSVVLCLAFVISLLIVWGNVPMQASSPSFERVNTISPAINESSSSPGLSALSSDAAFAAGDANEDGVIDMGDVVKVERIILGIVPPTPEADANLDGKVDMADIVRIERTIVLK